VIRGQRKAIREERRGIRVRCKINHSEFCIPNLNALGIATDTPQAALKAGTRSMSGKPALPAFGGEGTPKKNKNGG